MPNWISNLREKVSPADGIGLGVAIVLTLVFVFGVLTPLAMHDHQTTSRDQAAALQRQRLNQVQANVMKLSAAVVEARSQLDASGTQLQPIGALNKRLATLMTLANECGLAIDDLKPSPGARADQFIVVPIALHGRANYSNSVRFIHLLHDRVTDVRLDTFKLVGVPEDPSAASSFEFQLRWFASPDTGPSIASLLND